VQQRGVAVEHGRKNRTLTSNHSHLCPHQTACCAGPAPGAASKLEPVLPTLCHGECNKQPHTGAGGAQAVCLSGWSGRDGWAGLWLGHKVSLRNHWLYAWQPTMKQRCLVLLAAAAAISPHKRYARHPTTPNSTALFPCHCASRSGQPASLLYHHPYHSIP